MNENNRKVVTNLSLENSKLTNESIDKILRGEFSAMESYEQLMEKVNDDPEIERLEQFRDDHKKAASFWKMQVKREGKVPENSSSIWGKVVETFVGASKLAGNTAALKAIKKGEEHGLSLYEDMLNSDDLTPSQKVKITQEFIPNQMKHIESINAIENLDR